MADANILDPAHRLANYGEKDFVEAYARLRHLVMIHRDGEDFGNFLRGVCEATDIILAGQLDISHTRLVGWLSDLGFKVHNCNYAEDQGESPVG